MLREPATFRLPADASGPGSARRIVRDHASLPSDRLQDVLLAVSELVTNAVKHGSNPDGTIEMRLVQVDHMLRVEVADRGSDFRLRLDRKPASGGVGLRLVAEVASRVGSEDGGDGTVVWFEIDL